MGQVKVSGNSNLSQVLTPALLDAAYRATSYVVQWPGAALTLRIDEFSAPLDEILRQIGVREWAFVSACNPGSKLLSDALNQELHQSLIDAVNAKGYCWYPASGVPDAPGWKPEPSLMILGIALPEALILAGALGQNALLAGAIGGPARLHYLNRN